MTKENETVNEQEIERNLGTQPLDALMTELELPNHAVVELCKEGLTHKAMQRARKGRRLTPKMKVRITETMNLLMKNMGDSRHFGVGQLFNY